MHQHILPVGSGVIVERQCSLLVRANETDGAARRGWDRLRLITESLILAQNERWQRG